MTKDQKRYRLWIASAIQLARKSPNGKVNYLTINPRLDQSTAFSWMQWATAAGWLHTDGNSVYEGHRVKNWAITDILHELNYE